MAPTKQPNSRHQRWISTRHYARFAYATLIAPWPPFLLFLGLGASIGAITPLVQVWATRSLIDGLIQNPTVSIETPLLEILQPYWLWLGLITLTLFLQWIIYNASFQDYLAAQVNARVQQGAERRLLAKAMDLQLEQFEQPEYYQALQRARQALTPERIASLVDSSQRGVAQICGCLGLLWFFAQAHWAIALLLCGGSLPLIRWRIRSDREMID
ncbi:MAG: hypothetical protein GKR89_30490 [Candidatus Latescibacteria bacterium]|nr:hypothetical protein [Candidatus Latescibacterota bacterium]